MHVYIYIYVVTHTYLYSCLGGILGQFDLCGQYLETESVAGSRYTRRILETGCWISVQERSSEKMGGAGQEKRQWLAVPRSVGSRTMKRS